MASADFCGALTPQTSPGKVHELSARAVRLYPMRLSVTVGFCVLSHAHRTHRGLAACSCSYGRAFATDFFRAERLAAPALSFATVVVTASEHFVSYVEFMPMPGTRGRGAVPADSALTAQRPPQGQIDPSFPATVSLEPLRRSRRGPANKKPVPRNSERAKNVAGVARGSQIWIASPIVAAAASITASLSVGCAWMVWWISSTVASR
jgi:hypothetical protein